MRRLLVVLVVLAACSSGGGPKTVHVTYQFGGHATTPTVSYTTATGVDERPLLDTGSATITEKVGVDVPAGKQLTATIAVRYFGDERVTCSIVGSDGKVLSESSAVGVDNKATCEAAAA